MKKRLQGSSLGVVIVSLTMTVMLLFFAMTSGLQQLELATHLDSRGRARDAAESVLQVAMAKLCKDDSFGQARAGAVLRLEAPALPPETRAVLSFDPAVAGPEHIPYSTNNLLKDSAEPGDGCSVPRRACHLVALGVSGAHKIQIETVYVQPPFPAGCASAGPVKLTQVRLWGYPPGSVPTNPLLPAPSVPAHVYTNSAADDALVLGPNCDIYGNAAAIGTIQVDPSAVVRGEIQQATKPKPVPGYDVLAMYNNVDQYVGKVPYTEGKPVDTYCVVGGDLNISGDLELQGGVLAVNGHLKVNGELKGQGFVLATGNVTAEAGATFAGERKLAVLCGKDLTLSGLATSSYHFNGLLYAKGNIKAHDLTVLGSVICDDPNSRVDLERVDVVQTNVSVKGAASIPFTGSVEDGSDGESWIAQIQRQPDSVSPGQQLYYGSVLYSNKGDFAANSQWPPDDDGFFIKFVPGKAISVWRDQSMQEIAGGKEFSYDGKLENLQKLLVDEYTRYKKEEKSQEIGDIFGGKKFKKQLEELKAYLGKAVNAATQATPGESISVELNNLIPSIDRIRVVTWKESAPTR